MSIFEIQPPPAPPRDVCERKSRGNVESKAAHASIAEGAEALRQKVLAFIQEQGTNGATLHEIASALDLKVHTVSALLSELKGYNDLPERIRKVARRDGCGVCIAIGFLAQWEAEQQQKEV
jgi:hypothetical protein